MMSDDEALQTCLPTRRERCVRRAADRTARTAPSMFVAVASLALAFTPLPLSPRAQLFAQRTAASPACSLFDGLQWPWDEKSSSSSDEPGKFIRHNEASPGCAPLGVVTAGFSDDALEALAETIEDVYAGPDGATAQVPIAVLSKADLKLRLRDVLATVAERDSQLPDRPAQPRVPLVLLSGFSTTATSATVRALRNLGLSGGSDDKAPMFAVAVPNALDKTLSRLVEEIEGDHLSLSGQ